MNSFERDKNISNLQDRYRILAKLGSGGMADVFLGVQLGVEDFQRLVVIKRVHSRWLGSSAAIQMFIAEARTIAALSHPNIVKIYDLSKLGDDICIAMEYVNGENLHYVRIACKKKKNPIPLPVACKLTVEACKALQYAHSAKSMDQTPLHIVHRDISPHNLMIDRNGYVKVIDFGIAKSSLRGDLSSPGLIKGKYSYLSPDVFKYKEIDNRADLYALGLVFYELITQQKCFPFAKDVTIAEVFKRIAKEDYPPASSLVPGIPKKVDEIIAKATHKDRQKRYQNCEEFSDDIRKFAKSFAGLASNEEARTWFGNEFKERLEDREEFEKKSMAKLNNMASGASGTASLTIDQRANLATSSTPGISKMRTGSLNKPPSESSAVSILAKPPISPYVFALLIICLLASIAIMSYYLFWYGEKEPTLSPPQESPSQYVADAKIDQLANDHPANEEETKPSPTPKTEPQANENQMIVQKYQEPGSSATRPVLASLNTKSAKRKASKRHATNPSNPKPDPQPLDVMVNTKIAIIAMPSPLGPPRNRTRSKSQKTKPLKQPGSKKIALLSGHGKWSGEKTIKKGCAYCHNGKKAPVLKWQIKTPRQWNRFFARNRHNRFEKLELHFSSTEQKQALNYILKSIKDEEKIGITGVK